MIGNYVEKLDDNHVMDKEIYESAKEELINYLMENKEITLGEYRDLINSNRKNCMILLENFDRKKITKREENKRVLF
ncbi:SelB C-terminal domain-containing protein [Clostridium sp. CCUG 7971]|uniref:SelB domain-containing protein n=1 Tax=Clostridium sp. CCUG 7971 TaxID=2811414 RepID=UPI0025703892|nr:SelB C-terminal domain-containing protein [Clostridium sp. CCUG 7971]